VAQLSLEPVTWRVRALAAGGRTVPQLPRIAGLLALDMATFARATFAGSCLASRAGFAPTIASRVARAILLEGKPMTLVELTIEVQRRGCRSLDDPRIVAKAIRNYPN